ncbi:FAD-dependent oxidoreductase [Bradyrhizobium cenepequi]|uniref:FAD-dependent oxidoreductase n=1 Tax=Bradyrhizobium cenepequi TaxID=2821403 RepID=UPI001CE2B52F|nr:FAD-dependent oxidoreductase [Bradyrhizobium cenepequi]MCA6108606.1 FAD-dependent oxidoreductase [Bradyrhizobium cenepequi]
MTWQRAASLSSIRDGGAIGGDVGGTPVALYNLGGAIYATHGICTHALALLSEGWVEDGKIECPLHQGRFDIRTGKALCAPLTQDLRTYAVKLEGDDIFVDLDQSGARPADSAADKRPTDACAATAAVIVGAGQAAAAAIRAMRNAGFNGTIDLVGDEPHLPYERPPLSKDMLFGSGDLAACTRLSQADVESLGVRLHLGQQAIAVDPTEKQVTLGNGTGLPYGALLIATGGRARHLAIPGSERAGVLHLRTVEDAAAIEKALAAATHVAVVGGGFIGLELASAAIKRGVAATVLEREPEIMMRLLPAPLGCAFRRLAETHGVDVRRNAEVREITQRGARLGIVTERDTIEVDAVLVGIGLEPHVDLAAAAGCKVLGGIDVDAEGHTSVPGIWAAGDCALHPIANSGRRVRLESWHNAEEQGAAAGRSIAGAAPEGPAKKPWFWTDQFGLNIQMIGSIGPKDIVAREGGADAVAGTIYRTIDRDSGKLTGVVAFSLPEAIRQARTDLQATTPFDLDTSTAVVLADDETESTDASLEAAMNAHPSLALTKRYLWPEEGLTRIPDWVYTDETIYQREIEKIFHGRTWNYVALECEIPNPGDYIRSNVGPTPVVVSRAEDGSINVFENRCAHRAAEFCRELSGNAKEFVCPYHQWSYDLKGSLAGVPFRRGVNGKGGMPADFKNADHGLRKLNVTAHRGVVFASYCNDMESFPDYLGPEVLREFEATFDGRKPVLLGHYRHTLPGNWKLYHENLKDPYHATLLHTFLVTFGLLVAGNRSLMLADPTGRHGVMASAKSDGKAVASDTKKEMRAYREGMTLEEPRFMDFIDEFDSPWSVTMATIWPNLIIQREMNTLGVRHIVPTSPNEFIMKWTMFGFEGDSEEMTRHRLRQGNLMGPAGFLGLEDNEAIKFVQDGMQHVPNGEHLVKLDPEIEAGTAESLISEAAIRAMYKHWRQEMGL